MKQVAIIASRRLSVLLLRSVRLLILLACVGLTQPFAAVAQTNAPASLPPAAQEALNKGIMAAKLPDYPLAIRYFEEAREVTPDAPVIYLNMGLAESKIPGRELRAKAWFGAYLAAYPEAPNAAAVQEQIAMLEVRSQSNILRLIKIVQDALPKFSWHPLGRELPPLAADNDMKLVGLAELWAKAGDMKTALKTADLLPDARWKGAALIRIAEVQINSGNIAGAQKTAELIQATREKGEAQYKIAKAQARSGDMAGAQKTADLVQDAFWKSNALIKIIAEAQIKADDIAGAQQTLASAQETAALIQDEYYKPLAQKDIVAFQAKLGIAKESSPNRQSTSDTQPPIQPVIRPSDWLEKLDDSDKFNIEQGYASKMGYSPRKWNTAPFLDLASYLKSLPPNDDPEKVFIPLYQTARTIVDAHNVVTEMLKQQAGK